MELEALGPSVPSVILDEDGNLIDSRLPSGEPLQFVFEEIQWQQELSWEETGWDTDTSMFLRRGSMTCSAFFTAETTGEAALLSDFILKGVMTK